MQLILTFKGQKGEGIQEILVSSLLSLISTRRNFPRGQNFFFFLFLISSTWKPWSKENFVRAENSA